MPGADKASRPLLRPRLGKLACPIRDIRSRRCGLITPEPHRRLMSKTMPGQKAETLVHDKRVVLDDLGNPAIPPGLGPSVICVPGPFSQGRADSDECRPLLYVFPDAAQQVVEWHTCGSEDDMDHPPGTLPEDLEGRRRDLLVGRRLSDADSIIENICHHVLRAITVEWRRPPATYPGAAEEWRTLGNALRWKKQRGVAVSVRGGRLLR